MQSIPFGVQSLSESHPVWQEFCTQRSVPLQSAVVLHWTHRPEGSQTLPGPQSPVPASAPRWHLAGLEQRLETQLCPEAQSAARTHCTQRPRLESHTRSVEPHSRLSLHPFGLTQAPLLQLRPEGQSMSSLQVKGGRAGIPPEPPALPP